MLKLFFPAGKWGFLHFYKSVCVTVFWSFMPGNCCMFWSPTEGKRADSAFGDCHIHLVTETDMVLFRDDCSCEAKWLIKQWTWRFLHVFFYVYLQELHMKGDLPSEIFLHYTPGDIIWIYMGPRPLCIEKNRFFFSENQVFGLLFFFFIF